MEEAKEVLLVMGGSKKNRHVSAVVEAATNRLLSTGCWPKWKKHWTVKMRQSLRSLKALQYTGATDEEGEATRPWERQGEPEAGLRRKRAMS